MEGVGLTRRAVGGAARAAFRVVMGGVPHRHRFRASLLLAGAIAPVAWRAGLFTRLLRWRVNSARELALHAVLSALISERIEFEAPVALAGLDRLDEAVAGGRGVLLIAPHTMLARMAVRRLHERGYPVTALTADGPPRRSLVPLLQRSPFFLLAARDELARGRILFAMVDRTRPEPGITAAAETVRGTVHVADPLIRLALRGGSRVAFIASRLHAGTIETRIALPDPAAGDGAEAVRQQFIRFLQTFLAPAGGRAPSAPAGATRVPAGARPFP
jgi:hypothetical protein